MCVFKALKVFVCIVGLIASLQTARAVELVPSASLTLDQAFERLQDSGVDFKPVGKICEEVTRLIVQDDAGPHFQVETGIQFETAERIYGEIDVIKLKYKKGHLILDTVYEVKCHSDFAAAYHTLENQRERFYRAMREGVRHSHGPMSFVPTAAFHFNFSDLVPSERAVTAIKYIPVSQAGGEDFGFYTLPFTLEELMRLRKKLMQLRTEDRTHLSAKY